MSEKSIYFGTGSLQEVKNTARKLRKKYFKYKEAEVVYSLSHKKLMDLAGKAGALVRFSNTVLIDRDIFDEYLERYREPSTLITRREETDER